MAQYTKEEIALLRREYPVRGVDGVRKFIDRSSDSIRHKAKQQGITRVEGFRESSVDFRDLIKIKNPSSSYLLGLIWGDGCLQWNESSRQYSVSLTLQKRDFDDIRPIVSKFKIYKTKKMKKSWKQCFCAKIGHKTLAKFLKDNDFLIKSTASPSKILRLIPKELRHYFYRGWFDADGYNNGLPSGNNRTVIAGSFSQDWSDLQDLCKSIGINSKVSRVVRKNGNRYSILSFARYNEVMRFRDYLYQGEKMGLTRKASNFFSIREPLRPNALKQ